MKPKNIFITGASGLIGSHLAGALAEEGHAVCLLIRPSSGVSSEERWKRIADWLGLSPDACKRISVFSGDLNSPELNLSTDDARFLKNHAEEIIHAAASTSFSKRKRDETFHTNVTGLNNLLSLVEEGSCKHVHYISTAYVAGCTSALSMESFSNPSGFFNPYEESKHQAEILISEFCRRKNIRLFIYRPSIVYGNSITGRTFRFNALYHPIRSIAYLRDLFRKDISENAGIHAQKLGIFQNTESPSLHMPIRFQKGQGTGLNLVPIDYCTRSILELMKAPGTEEIFHIINTQSTPLDDIVSFAGRFLDVSGMYVEGSSALHSAAPDPLDHLFRRYMEPYQPYIEDTRVFDENRAAQILAPLGTRCPTFSYPIFERCMTYAIENKWGRTIGL